MRLCQEKKRKIMVGWTMDVRGRFFHSQNSKFEDEYETEGEKFYTDIPVQITKLIACDILAQLKYFCTLFKLKMLKWRY